jgi:hypothetical protein
MTAFAFQARILSLIYNHLQKEELDSAPLVSDCWSKLA